MADDQHDGSVRHHAERAMGTTVSLVLPADTHDVVIERSASWLHRVDEMFDVRRDDSEVSRLAASTLALDDASPDVREVLSLCESMRKITKGAFTTYRPELGRPIDPSELVKGWAIDRLATDLLIADVDRFCISIGGDVLCRSPEGQPPWRVGIRHPVDGDAIAAALNMQSGSIATASDREGNPAARNETDVLSVSVIGRELGFANAVAGAIRAAGPWGERGPDWLEQVGDPAVIVMTADGSMRWSKSVEAMLIAPTASDSG